MRVSAVILAAGAGTRFGTPEAKVWARLAGRPLLDHVISAFRRAGAVDELVVVIRAGDEHRLADIAPVGIPLTTAFGGDRRADSARAGLAQARGELVLIHDGARPLVTPELIRRVLAAAGRHGAAVPILPVSDTVRYAQNGYLQGELVNREVLVRVQTPQGFERSLLAQAYAQAAGKDLPDDAAAVLALGHPVAAVPGDPANFKVTYPEDLALAERILASAR